jgi:hypothetical protein
MAKEIDLHLKVGYIDADIPSFTNFSLAVGRRTIHFRQVQFTGRARDVNLAKTRLGGHNGITSGLQVTRGLLTAISR